MASAFPEMEPNHGTQLISPAYSPVIIAAGAAPVTFTHHCGVDETCGLAGVVDALCCVELGHRQTPRDRSRSEQTSMIQIEAYYRIRHGRLELVRAHWRKLPSQ